jgi:hypothetical protein
MNDRGHNPTTDDIGTSRKVTGKELEFEEEIRVQLSTLVEILDERGIINKNEYQRIVSMRLHEISKALAFEEIDEEI